MYADVSFSDKLNKRYPAVLHVVNGPMSVVLDNLKASGGDMFAGFDPQRFPQSVSPPGPRLVHCHRVKPASQPFLGCRAL